VAGADIDPVVRALLKLVEDLQSPWVVAGEPELGLPVVVDGTQPASLCGFDAPGRFGGVTTLVVTGGDPQPL